LRRASHHQRVVAAGPWSFPAPSSVLPVARWTLEGADCPPYSSSRHLAVMGHRVPAPAVLALLQSFADSPRLVDQPPLLGFVRSDPRAEHLCPFVRRPTSSPLHRHAPLRPLPARCRHRAFGPWHTMPGVLFRPRGFAPPRRFSPLGVAGLLHPAANRGVRRVSGSCPLFPGCTSLPRAVPTPRRIPLIHSRTVSPRPSAFLTFTRRAARASRVRVAAPALLRASRFELAFKALLCE
jgi:hypothetical protein